MWTILRLVLVGGLLGSGCAAAPDAPPFRPVADNKLLMQALLDPAAGKIWGAVGSIITLEGEQELVPKNDEEWAEVRNAALLIVESGNLLMMAPRARNGDDWMRVSQGLIDTGTEALRAAEAKDKEKLFTVGGNIYNVCTNCHVKYSPEMAGARP